MVEREPGEVEKAEEEAAADTAKTSEPGEAGDETTDADDAMGDASFDTEKTPDVTDDP